MKTATEDTKEEIWILVNMDKVSSISKENKIIKINIFLSHQTKPTRDKQNVYASMLYMIDSWHV